jgi:plastocyanin
MLLGVGVALAALVSGTHASDQVVNVSDYAFSPRDVTVAVGEKVIWTNTQGEHNVRFDDGSFEMPSDAMSGWTVERTFNAPGTFGYYCEPHGGPGGSGMSGTVTVTAPAPTPGPVPPGSPPPAPPPPGAGPEPLTRPEVTFRVSNPNPRAGQRIRLFGLVRPELDGRPVQIQRRTRAGSFKTVARTTLRDAGEDRSKFARRIRVFRDSVFRARVPPDSTRESATSRRRRVDVSAPQS